MTTDLSKPAGNSAREKASGAMSVALTGCAVLVAATLLYLATLARVVHPDGPHFAKAVREYSLEYTFFPGHLFYGNVCRNVWQLAQDFGYHGNVVFPLQILSALAGALGVFFFYFVSARLFASPKLRIFLTAALATSFGYWTEATYFVKPYALSMAILMLSLWLLLIAGRRASALWPLLAGAAAALSTTIHITNIAWCVFACALMLIYGRWASDGGEKKRRWGIAIRNSVLAVGTQIVLVWAAYTFVYNTYIIRQDPSVRAPGGLIGWIRSSDHGYVYGFTAENLRDAFYGFARAIYYVNDLLEGPLWKLAAGVLAIYALLIFLAVAGFRLKKYMPRGVRAFLAAAAVGAVPYIGLGLKFFSKDAERWLWLVPPLALAVGGVLAAWHEKAGASRPSKKYAVALVVLLALAANNFFRMVMPLHFEDRGYGRAEFVAGFLKSGDFLLSPGHGWDDYVWLFNDADYKTETAAYFAYYGPANPIDIFRDPGTKEGEWHSLDRMIKETLASGHNVYAIRIFDPRDTYEGWLVSKEKGFQNESREELIKYAQERFSDAEMGKMFISYFSFAGRTEVLEKQMGAEKTREIAMNYLPLFYNEYKDSEESFSYYLNHEEFLQAKDYFDHLAPQYNSLTAKPPDVYLLWRSLTMIPLDARLYRLYLSQYRWKTAGIFKDKNGTATLWRLEKTGEEMKKP